MKYHGGCQCGAVRYTVTVDRLTAYACHCLECQKQSASAFGISVPVLEDDFGVTGELSNWGRTTHSGSYTDCYFCPKCGTRLYHSGHNRPGLITVKGGSFDKAEDLTFAAHVWVSRKVAWIDLPEDASQWQTQPQTLEEWMTLLDRGA